MSNDKKIKDLLAKASKQFGKNAVMFLEDQSEEDHNVDVISTGVFSLDKVLGVGGIPRGRMIEIYGPESAGKTTLALCVVAEAQKLGLRAAYIDAEHALDPGLAQTLGVDTSKLLISQPDHGEQSLEIVDMLARSGEIGVVVVDSVAALVPKAELEGDMGSAHMGLQARLMSQACRKLTSIISQTKTTIIWINQLRNKIGVFFGSPETTTGGNALKFYCSMRLDVRNAGRLTVADTVVGHKMAIKVVKNKFSAPHRRTVFELIYGKGINHVGDVVDAAVEAGVIQQSGSWFTVGEDKIQGRGSVIDHVCETPGLIDSLIGSINAGAKE